MERNFAHEACAAFGNYLKRCTARAVSVTNEGGDATGFMEVVGLSKGFQIVLSKCAQEVTRKSMEVNTLKREKQILEHNLQRLTTIVSTLMSREDKGSSVEFEGRSNKPSNLNGDVEGDQHLKCDERALNQDLKLAKLQEGFFARTSELKETRRKLLVIKKRLKNAEVQASAKEEQKQDLQRSHDIQVQKLKRENGELRKSVERLEENLARASLRNEQFAEILKRDSKQQDELKRQEKSLKGYLRLLAMKFAASGGSDEWHLDVKSLECKGLDDETTDYLRVIVDKGLGREKLSTGTQTMSMYGVQSLSSDRIPLSSASEGTASEQSGSHPVEPSLIDNGKEIDDNVVHEPEMGYEHRDNSNEGCDNTGLQEPNDIRAILPVAGAKRQAEIIDLTSDTEDEPHIVGGFKEGESLELEVLSGRLSRYISRLSSHGTKHRRY